MKMDKRTAKAAGLLYVVIILGSVLGGILTEMYMQSHLAGNAADTANRLILPDGLYRIGFVIYLLVYLSDLAAAVILYELLKPVNKGLALLAAFFRFAEATILAMNMQNHYNAFMLLQGAGSPGIYQFDQLQTMASFYLDAHRSTYLISQIFFGVHCFFLGYLLIKSGYFPRFLGTFLIAASFGYLIESFTYFLFPNYEGLGAVVSWISAVPAFLAEISLTYWLLFRGENIEKQYQQAAAPV
jgi:hypothetical protein